MNCLCDSHIVSNSFLTPQYEHFRVVDYDKTTGPDYEVNSISLMTGWGSDGDWVLKELEGKK